MNIVCTTQRHIPGKLTTHCLPKKKKKSHFSCIAKGQSSFRSIHKKGQIA